MGISLNGLLVLGSDVVLVPVTELPEDTRSQIECEAGDFAVSRPQARAGSKIVDAGAASLLGRFRVPRTVSEAVILFSREHALEPADVLDGAHELLHALVDGGFLLKAGDEPEGPPVDAHAPAHPAGSSLLGGTVVRTIDVLDDTEILLLDRGRKAPTVVKIERRRSDGVSDDRPGGVRDRIRHEVAYLTRLGGAGAPAILGSGDCDGRLWIEMGFVAGVDAVAAATEWRDRAGERGRAMLLALIRVIGRAYSDLHRRGVLHGDVHPRNLLVDDRGAVTLIDFGVASTIGDPRDLPRPHGRGGIPFFFEPEMASAARRGAAAPPPSEAGEQYAVAAMLWFLAAGAHCQDYRLGRDEMLDDIATGSLRTFSDRGVPAWPALEAVLRRALEKEPSIRYPSMEAFARALDGVTGGGTPALAVERSDPVAIVTARAIESASVGGPWMQGPFEAAPTTSITYGSAGVALGLLHMAWSRRESRLLSLADAWSRRAIHEIDGAGAFHNEAIQITPEIVGRASPFHAPSGVHAVSALIATASGDRQAIADAVRRFAETAVRPAAGLDLAVGRSSVVLGAAILLDALGANPQLDPSELVRIGDDAVEAVWRELDAKPPISDSDIQYPGIAHGWAGYLYATLWWCRIRGIPVPARAERRLLQLAALAIPVGRGLEWPWILRRDEGLMTMPGWCNGTCGYVFLWNLAHRHFGDERYAALAHGAASRTWESTEGVVTVCCGLAGRAYALLNHHRHTGDGLWLERARDLTRRACSDGRIPAEYPHGLYKGEFGLAVLGADLQRPDEARMPFFEPIGFTDAAR